MKVTEFENKLIKFKAKKINLNNDYEYYVRIGLNGKRRHLSKNDKDVEKLSNGKIKSNDDYLCYVIDVNNRASDLVKMRINSFYKILIITKVENGIIKDYCVYFPMIEDGFARQVRRELFNE